MKLDVDTVAELIYLVVLKYHLPILYFIFLIFFHGERLAIKSKMY